MQQQQLVRCVRRRQRLLERRSSDYHYGTAHILIDLASLIWDPWISPADHTHTHILLMWCVQYTVYIIVWSNKASCIVATIRKKRRKRIKFDAKFPIRPGYKPRFIEDSKRIAFNKGGHNRKQERWRAMDISSHHYARGHKRRKLFLPISLIHILFFFIVKHEFM